MATQEPSFGIQALAITAIVGLLACDTAKEPPASAQSSTEEVAEPAGQILFGDLHVHTTYSVDASMFNLPIFQGSGLHPPQDACDFARYCSKLDFWSINDHAEGLTPELWEQTQAGVRECNERAGDPSNPELVSFLGWEWSNSGATPETHWGHRNVILRDDTAGRVPTRPIASSGPTLKTVRGISPARLPPGAVQSNSPHRELYRELNRRQEVLQAVPLCPAGESVRGLPPSCLETAATPTELYRKLRDWNFDVLVIPHGQAWGLSSRPGISWDNELATGNFDAGLEKMIEVYSGHGNSEAYRSWRHEIEDATGAPACPEPSEGFTADCWQAGEIIRDRCLTAELPEAECELRAAKARKLYLQPGSRGYQIIPGQTAKDWGDSGQCTDCFLPAYGLRPTKSVQYALAARNFDQPGPPARLRYGLIGSSDNHTARAGSGYKELGRLGMTDASGWRDSELSALLSPQGEPLAEAQKPARPRFELMGNPERSGSFFYTGGLVAVHSQGRDRNAIFDALSRREVYATSGPRILLSFDLVDEQGEVLKPMGSELQSNTNPRFQVRAQGAFQQKPGCPEESLSGLGPERLEAICMGECYHPSDKRIDIERIEVVRIRPQISAEEPVESLIEDPWKTFDCDSSPGGCRISFEDPDFAADSRDTVYYVRALQVPTPVINGAGLRCRYDQNGDCVDVRPCYADYRTEADDNCLAEASERAWSSPIFVDFGILD